jgi:hypothetical protein
LDIFAIEKQIQDIGGVARVSVKCWMISAEEPACIVEVQIRRTMTTGTTLIKVAKSLIEIDAFPASPTSLDVTLDPTMPSSSNGSLSTLHPKALMTTAGIEGHFEGEQPLSMTPIPNTSTMEHGEIMKRIKAICSLHGIARSNSFVQIDYIQ